MAVKIALFFKEEASPSPDACIITEWRAKPCLILGGINSCQPFFNGNTPKSPPHNSIVNCALCEIFVVGGIKHLFVDPIYCRRKSGTILFLSSCELYCQSGCIIRGRISSIIIAFFNLTGQAAQVRLG